jgi:hypothetical protein
MRLHPPLQNDMEFLRVRSNKQEIMVAPSTRGGLLLLLYEGGTLPCPTATTASYRLALTLVYSDWCQCKMPRLMSHSCTHTTTAAVAVCDYAEGDYVLIVIQDTAGAPM